MQESGGHRSITLALVLAMVAGGAAAATSGGAAAAPLDHGVHAAVGVGPTAKPVDINSASRAELKTLPGIADAEAERIIKARPYLSKAKLVAENILPYPTYLGLKGRIVALQPEPKKAKRSAAS